MSGTVTGPLTAVAFGGDEVSTLRRVLSPAVEPGLSPSGSPYWSPYGSCPMRLMRFFLALDERG
jgi:hypothetical protein